MTRVEPGGPTSAAAHRVTTRRSSLSSAAARWKPKHKCAKKLNKFIDHNVTQGVLMMLVIYALFGEDFRAFTEKPADIYFDIVTTVCMVAFLFEIVFQSIGRPHEYLFSPNHRCWLGFYFVLDVVSTGSMIPDLTYIMNPLLGDDVEGAGTGTADALTNAKTARTGAKAARFVRVVRLVRMVRVIKLYKMAQGKNKSRGDDGLLDTDITMNGGSKVGKKLTESVTQKIVILILAMVIIIPFFDLGFLEEGINRYQQEGLTALHHMRMDRNWTRNTTHRCSATTILKDGTLCEDGWTMQRFISGDRPLYSEMTQDHNTNGVFKSMMIQYSRDSGRLMYLDVSKCPPKFCNTSWPRDVTNEWLKVAKYHPKDAQEQFEYGSPFLPHTALTKPVTEANFTRWGLELDEIKRRYRSNEAPEYFVQGCYSIGEDGSTPQLADETEADLEDCEIRVVFFEKWNAEFIAMLSIFKTIFIMAVLVLSAYGFSNDIENYVIAPLDRMINLVTQLSKNPLGKLQRAIRTEEIEPSSPSKSARARSRSKSQSHHLGHASAHEFQEANTSALEQDYETHMIEETLAKIGQLLQVGFGTAGKKIIAANMKSGDLQVLLPGSKVTAVFGFVIIEHFTETVTCLEAKICMYINAIANIVHTGVANYYGGANKNMGGGVPFGEAWKICDGQLPGLRDPRDTSPEGAGDSEAKRDAQRRPSGKDERLLGFELDSEDRIKEQRARIRIPVMGAGRMPRDVTPMEMVDSALAAFVKVRVDVHNANEEGTMGEYLHHPKVRKLFGPDFKVTLGYGMHIGWAIEGAIGSKFKMDVSYLSPNVNMSARLEAATHQFECPMLISEWLVGELSPSARDYCRLIDRVTVKGSAIPMSLYTFDIFTFPRHIFRPQFDKYGRQEPVNFQDLDVRDMRVGVPPEFFDIFNKAVQDYLAGNWPLARMGLEQCQEMRDEDGPTKSLLRVMGRQQFQAPAAWPGFRALTEK